MSPCSQKTTIATSPLPKVFAANKERSKESSNSSSCGIYFPRIMRKHVRLLAVITPMLLLWVLGDIITAFNMPLNIFMEETTEIFRSRKGSQTVMCLCIKDEEQYLDEFVDYHTALGFAKFYIYDNSENHDLQQWGQEKNRLDGYNIQITHYPGQAVQSRAYLDCGQRALADGYTWAAFFDVDEYLILNRDTGIDTFLGKYCRQGALSINWVNLGTAGREVYSPQPLTKRFRYATSDTVSNHLKTIARLEHMDMEKEPHAHFTWMKPGYDRKMLNGVIPKGHLGHGGRKEKAPALLYHYTYRSYKEYLFKRLYRGRATVNATDPSHQDLIGQAKAKAIPKGNVYDDRAWKAMKKLVPKYQYYDELFPDPPPLPMEQ